MTHCSISPPTNRGTAGVPHIAAKLTLIALIFLQGERAAAQTEEASASASPEDLFTEKLTYVNVPSNLNWENLEFDARIYDKPFQISLFNSHNGEDGKRLWSQTKAYTGYLITLVGAVALLPDNLKSYDEEGEQSALDNWVEHVDAVMVWDRNKPVYNFIGHPYAGGMYYQMARKSGYRQWDSFVYSAMMSTVWEYGFEAVAEFPSVQDVFLTPVLGWVVGEWMFNQEQVILQRGKTVWGSRGLGSTALFFLDPIDSISTFVNNKLGRRLIHAGTGYINYDDVALGDSPNAPTEKQFTVGFTYTLGRSDEPNYAKRYHALTNDPIDTGLVGISLGAGHIRSEDLKDVMPIYNIEQAEFGGGTYPEWTVGLYFTPRFSTRLRYGRAKLKNLDTSEAFTYENYGVDGQYYFNVDKKTRPFINAGIGEEIFDENKRTKTVLWNVGLGLHHQFNDKWAISGSLRHEVGPSEDISNESFSASVIYRFGRGER